MNNYIIGGARETEKGCIINSEVYRVQCTNQKNSTQRVNCCKQDMCNDFTISDEGNGKPSIFTFL